MKNTTHDLLDILALRFDHGSLLDIGSPAGVISTWASAQGHKSCYHHVDLQACQSVVCDSVDIRFSAELPNGPFSVVSMDATALDATLACDLAFNVTSVLDSDGEFLSVPPKQWTIEKWIDYLRRAFSSIQVVSESEHVTVIGCKSPTEDNVMAEDYTITRRIHDREYVFHSQPGVFSLQSIDKGTLAMLDEIVKIPLASTASILDLGCGVGVVGIHLATVWNCSVVAVDTNARALRCTSLNATENEVSSQVRVVASNGFSSIQDEVFDMVATNPPYHSDYSVAKGFIQGAHKQLRTGGRLWVVVKRPDWYINRIRSVFHGCTVIQKDGYFILTAVKKVRTEVRHEKAKHTSRKHQKKMAVSESKKRLRRP